MIKKQYSFKEFSFSSQLIRDLIDKNKQIKPFVTDFFSIEQIKKQIEQKEFTSKQREVLVDCLEKQNLNIELTKASKSNIELLKQSNTYTITTGHQLNILTGPLYSIYKVLQVIVWCEKLNQTDNLNKFVPIFWMATEDHDFDEINHINLFNQKIEWKKNNQINYIAGAIETDDNFNHQFKQKVLDLFKDESLKKKVEHLLSYYNNTNLATASRQLLNDLFGEFGLIIIDGNDPQLKQQFLPVIQQELSKNITYNTVSLTNEKLTYLGYHQQVFLRECNLFYIENKATRHRIIKTELGFNINSKEFTVSELVKEAETYPERFSPNALLRPVYQETVLPNIVYIGGGGEIAYWLQLKTLFNQLQLVFPLLRVRDSYVLMNQKQTNQIKELNLSILDLKQPFDDLIKQYIKTKNNINFDKENLLLNELKTLLQQKINKKDVGLFRFIESEVTKMNNQLNKIEKKILQSEKKQQEQLVHQIKKLKEKIYPNNGFQERFENFIQYVYQPNFIEKIKNQMAKNVKETPFIDVIIM